MKKLILSFALALSVVSSAQAKTPKEVLEPYKAYRTAIKNNDAEAAHKYGYEAWQKAEVLLGDSKTTGDLAQNFAVIITDKKNKDREKAYARAIELASLYDEGVETITLDRYLKFATYYRVMNKHNSLYGVLKDAAKYAEANGQTNSTFYGEIKTLQSEYFARKGNSKRTKEYADAALAIFERANDDVVTVQPLMAHLYAGFGDESLGKPMDAALNYQKVMEATDGMLAQDHPFVAQALGRWAHMRYRLYEEGKLEEAEQKGLCKCWPYDKERNEDLKPIKQQPGRMPSNAHRSGYAIVEFDLDDAGNVINPEVITSWPGDVYDKDSVRAVKKWAYPPRVPGETDEQRSDLITTMRYRLTDQNGDVIY